MHPNLENAKFTADVYINAAQHYYYLEGDGQPYSECSVAMGFFWKAVEIGNMIKLFEDTAL